VDKYDFESIIHYPLSKVMKKKVIDNNKQARNIFCYLFLQVDVGSFALQSGARPKKPFIGVR